MGSGLLLRSKEWLFSGGDRGMMDWLKGCGRQIMDAEESIRAYVGGETDFTEVDSIVVNY